MRSHEETCCQISRYNFVGATLRRDSTSFGTNFGETVDGLFLAGFFACNTVLTIKGGIPETPCKAPSSPPTIAAFVSVSPPPKIIVSKASA
mmetsp:Transcript_13762/g.15192  ORF Transcript_13762/g.15192 Transcript_13762/m.15192 type:complete len:91 (+) Transcript_13762:108-380(+)